MPLPTIEEYLGRVTAEHQNAPNFMTMMQLLLQPVVDNQNFLASLPAAFDVDQAIGVQLDVDGIWIGRSRNIVTPQVIDYFSFDIPHLGFDTTAFWYQPGAPLTYSTTLSLNDDDYRRLLYSKIAANSWDGTALDATAALVPYFGNYGLPFVIDMCDMTTQICFSGSVLSGAPLAVFAFNYIPIKPSGVTPDYLVASAPAPLFGFDASSDYVAGFDEGAWGVSPEYLILRNFGPTQFIPYSLGAGATGPALDIPGQVIGPSRIIPVETPLAAFAFDTPGQGFDGPAWRIDGQPTYSIVPDDLDDSDYSDLLEAAILANAWDGSANGLIRIVQTYLTDAAVLAFKNTDGSWIINVSYADMRPVDAAILSNIILPTALSKVNVTFNVASVPDVPLFGFDRTDGSISGFDQGAWAVLPSWLQLNPTIY